MANKFTIFEKFGNACQQLNEPDRKAFMAAIMEYGMFGTEPNLQYPLNAMFELVREDIDNSVNASNTNKGGRPKNAKPQEKGVIENSKGGFSNSKTGGFENSKTPHSEEAKTPPYKDKPRQDNTSQDIEKEKEKEKARKKFAPPTPADVEQYVCEWLNTRDDLQGAVFSATEAERFVDYYAANGWKRNKTPIKDWHACARNWVRNDFSYTNRKGVSDEQLEQQFAAYA